MGRRNTLRDMLIPAILVAVIVGSIWLETHFQISMMRSIDRI